MSGHLEDASGQGVPRRDVRLDIAPFPPTAVPLLPARCPFRGRDLAACARMTKIHRDANRLVFIL